MTSTINSKKLDQSKYASYKIIVDGKNISSSCPVVSIQAVSNFNKIPTAVITISDGEQDVDNFDISSSKDFNIGKEIEIKLGFGGSDYTVFRGVIIRHSITASNRKGFFLTVYCRNEALKMTVDQKFNCFNKEESDDALISSIFNDYSIDVSSSGDYLDNKTLIQYNQTDWDFILERVVANGKVLFYDCKDDSFIIETPETPSSPLYTYNLGKDVVDFEVEADSESQLQNISSYSWDSTEQEMIQHDSSASKFKNFENTGIKESDLNDVVSPSDYILKHAGERDISEFKSWTNAKAMRASLSKVKGFIQIVGDSRYNMGDCIKIDGSGTKFSDNILISGLRHVFDSEGYYTDIIFGLDNYRDYDMFSDVKKPQSLLFSEISGLQIAKVVNIIDEDGLNRIQVKLPILGEDAEVWSRMLFNDAGNERGFYCLPEIDDEVILGFINNDPQCPVILGSLFSKKNIPPIPAEEITEDNDIKGWFSKSKMKIIVNDKEQSLKIETPESNVISINDELKTIEIIDVNENKIQLTDSLLNIESKTDITIKSDGGALNIESASGDINIDATNINLNASGSMSAKANGGMEIQSSANTVIKGSMVQIN